MAESWKSGDHNQQRISIVIVTYRSRRTIDATLQALRESQEGGLARVIVVDNASDDGTADFVSQHYPSVTLIRNAGNVGFGRGCNQGIELASTPFILLLNPDAVIDARSLAILLDFLDRNPRVGICGPAVIDESGALQPAGGLPKPWKIIIRPLSSKLASREQRFVVPGEAASETDTICGSIMLLRKEMIDMIGAFDPRFFLYFEETDLCCRAREAGWEIWTVGEAVGRHVNAASAKQTNAEMLWDTISEHYFRSRFYYLIKHFGWPAAVFSEIGEIASMVLGVGVDALRGKPRPAIGARLRAPIMRMPIPPDRGVRSEGVDA
jgi:N-acetylglucosaminyl-diphospho-decaprenol L-rhamnosyltransferase